MEAYQYSHVANLPTAEYDVTNHQKKGINLPSDLLKK